MLNFFHLFISFILLVVVVGNPAVPVGNEFDLEIAQRCDKFTPIVLTTPQEVAGEWVGVDIVKNIGVGKYLNETKKTCLYGGVNGVDNYTRYWFDQKMLEGEDVLDHNKSFFADLDPATGVVSPEGYSGKELRIIAVNGNKTYVTVVYCGKRDTLPFVPITKIVTFRRRETPDLPPQEEKMMHDEIKNKLGVDLLIFGKLHCRHHGKN